jgi:hypothetical protein
MHKWCFPTGMDSRGGSMTTLIKLISEVNQMVTDLLIKGVGVVDTIRFLNQFRPGQGDYTKDRKKLFEGMEVKDIVVGI